MAARKHIVTINRAPVLTLWAAVVAHRLGFNWDESLSLGKTVAGLNAQSKGRRLGIFTPSKAETKKARRKKRGEEFRIDLLGRAVPAKNTDDGIRAVNRDKPVSADSVETYLEKKFGDDLDRVRKAMKALAKSYKPSELREAAYGLYEDFRPEIPGGTKGWGAKGDLNLNRIRGMVK